MIDDDEAGPDAADPSATDPATDQPAAPVDLQAIAKKWLQEVEDAKRATQDYESRAEKIVRIFTEQRKAANTSSTKRKMSLLYANVSVLQPSVYARTPQPVVQRRFRDRDPVARQACEMVERSLVTTFDENNVDGVLTAVRDDYLLVARGTAWVRYEPVFAPAPPPMPGQPAQLDDKGQPVTEVLIDERAAVDYVHWRDFITPKSRIFKELPWGARAVYMTRQELVSRFGQQKANKVTLDHKPSGSGANSEGKSGPEDGHKATVYEIWSKVDKKCIWVSPGCDEALDYADPHLDLRDFFPFPRPAYGTLSTDSLIPTPDYVFYQDQAEEVDDLTDRISCLIEQLKLVGFYPAGPSSEGSAAIEIAAKPGTQNVLVPVPNWAAFADKGGSAAIQWWPVEQVIKVLEGCFNARKALIADIFQVTGISDIIRGDTDPNETKGAQVIKESWGNVRLRDRQKELARFARDITRLLGEVIADKFQPDTLMRLSQMTLPWQAELDQQFQQQHLAWQQEVTQIRLAQQAAMLQNGLAPANGAQVNPGVPQGGLGGGQGPVNGAAAGIASGTTPQGGAPAGGPSGGAPLAGPAPNGAPGPASVGQGAPQGAPAGPPAPPPQPALPPEPQPDTQTVTMDAVLQLLRDDRLRSCRVDIETDSTVEADENQYKQRLQEFLTGVALFLDKVLPIGQQHPELVPFLGEVLTTVVRGFRIGRQLEGSIEEAVQTLTDRAAQASQNGPPPNPELEATKIESQAKIQGAMVKADAEKAKANSEQNIAALNQQQAAQKHEQAMREMTLRMQMMEREHQLAQAEHDRKMQLAGMAHHQEISRLREQQIADQSSVLAAPVGDAGGGDGGAPSGDAPLPETPMTHLAGIKDLLLQQAEAQQAALQAHNDNASRHAEALAMLAQHLAPRSKTARKRADGSWELH